MLELQIFSKNMSFDSKLLAALFHNEACQYWNKFIKHLKYSIY